MAEHPDLVLTGTVYPDGNGRKADETEQFRLVPIKEAPEGVAETTELGGEKYALVPDPYEPGDVDLVSRMSARGRRHAAGGHTNMGYAGYFRARVFDGKRWRNFKIWDFVPKEVRNYDLAGDKGKVAEEITEIIEVRTGKRLTWGDRAYEIAGD